jgi:diaminopimelate decarboxylase
VPFGLRSSKVFPVVGPYLLPQLANQGLGRTLRFFPRPGVEILDGFLGGGRHRCPAPLQLSLSTTGCAIGGISCGGWSSLWVDSSLACLAVENKNGAMYEQADSCSGEPDEAVRLWWQRPGLEAVGGRLTICGRDAETLARAHGTPLYVYDLERIDENVRALRTAMRAVGAPLRIRAALKAQREPQVLARVRLCGLPGSPEAVGLDVCSPGEVEHALANGFLPTEISYTGTNLSDRDIDRILDAAVHVNLDLISQIHRYGRRARGGTVGMRVNPRISAVGLTSSRHDYSGDKPTKFGIYSEQLGEAVAIARQYDLTVDTVHCHVAHQLQTQDLPRFEQAVAAVAEITRRLMGLGCPIAEVNMGGGLAACTMVGSDPVRLDSYAAVLRRHLRPLGVAIGVEPGEYFSRDAGTLLAEVVTVEDRSFTGDGSALFAGLDCGWNIMSACFVYQANVGIVLCRAATARSEQRYTVTGHINEGPDIFAEDAPLPTLVEGDVVAVLGVGAYYQAMWHRHCLRPLPEVMWLNGRTPAPRSLTSQRAR